MIVWKEDRTEGEEDRLGRDRWVGKEDWEMEKERNDWKERNRRGEGGEEKGKKRRV